MLEVRSVPQKGERAPQMEDGGDKVEDGCSEFLSRNSALRARSNGSPPPPPTPSHDPDGADPHGSWEDRYWSHAKALQSKGVARSMLGRLANLLAGDFERGIGMLQDTLAAKGSARAYFAKIIRNLEAEQLAHARPAIQAEAGVPKWVIEARADGERVTREGQLWRWGFSLYSDTGEQVGM